MDLLSNSLNDFGFELFRTVYSSKSQVDENVIISSFSVAIAMLMTLGGARNETSSELIRSLFRSGKENSVSLHESVRSLIRSINVKEDENNRIVVANKMILNSVGVHDQFRELISNVYESSVDTVRSESSVNQLTEETNRWISELTEGRIKSIVDEETLKETSIALINAVYFKMQWLIGFNEAETRDEEFRVSAQKTKELPMMRLTRTKLPYFYSDLLKSHLLSLPYKGGRHSFNIVFPDDEADFLVFDDEKSLIRNLKYESLVGEMSKLSEQKVNVRIPKFTQEKKIKLAETLQQLGIRSAFDSSNANFTGISDERLFIRDVLQYAFIDVNEKGTEAAAATVVQIQKRSIEITPEVILNRPFIYYISDKTSNTIIFLGTFNGETPSESIKNNERTEL